MSNRDAMMKEICDVPEELLGEVVDFARFLRAKAAGEVTDTTLASEPVLKKDWLRPEEDDAWKDL